MMIESTYNYPIAGGIGSLGAFVWYNPLIVVFLQRVKFFLTKAGNSVTTRRNFVSHFTFLKVSLPTPHNGRMLKTGTHNTKLYYHLPTFYTMYEI